MSESGKTVTRVDLCEAVYQKVGLSRTESAAFVELVLKEITDCLEKGETVKLKKDAITFATTIKSVNSFGQLITQDGMERQFNFGEVEWVVT